MATIVDVARLAGVSTSTVSHVVNGTRHVEPTTRERVEAAIQATGYKQDALARAMKRSQSDSIGLIVSDPGEPAFAEMVRGVERAAAALGLTLLLANSAEDPQRELKAAEVLLARRVDGLILARSSGSTDDVLVEIERQGTPLVLIDRIFDLPLDQVGVKNAEAMKELVAHLAGHGHRTFGLVGGDLQVPTLRERYEGFVTGLRAEDLEVDEDLVVLGDVEVEKAYEHTRAVLNRPDRPTALIASGTILAAGALRAIEEAGLRLPDDLSFATFDGFDYADLFEPALTTVRQPAFDVGTRALQLLTERIANPKTKPRTIRLDPRVEYRRSTDGRPSAPADLPPRTRRVRTTKK
jgi:LacI family transcriptional regulator